MFNRISFEKLLEVTVNDLALIKENLEQVYANTEIDEESRQAHLAEAFRKVEDWSTYFGRFKEISDARLDTLELDYNILKNESDKLSSELVDAHSIIDMKNAEISELKINLEVATAKLMDENNRLNYELNDAREIIDSNNAEIIDLKTQLGYKDKLLELKNESNNTVHVDLVELIDKLDAAVNLVNDNVKAISLSKKLKTEPRVNMHGAEHPRYRNDIDNESLIADYKAGTILKDLSDKYGISVPGIRNRLIDLGVYQNKYNTNK